MKKTSIIVSLLVLSFQLVAQNKFPEIKNHWLRAAPPNAMMLAAYGQLTNNTGEEQILIGAYSPDFTMAEIHETTITNGIAKMAHQEAITLAKGQTLKFQPNGLHIMLMHPTGPIKIGEKIKICLIYKNGEEQEVQHIFFPVEKK